MECVFCGSEDVDVRPAGTCRCLTCGNVSVARVQVHAELEELELLEEDPDHRPYVWDLEDLEED